MIPAESLSLAAPFLIVLAFVPYAVAQKRAFQALTRVRKIRMQRRRSRALLSARMLAA